MSLDQFVALQQDFIWAFGWLARWWLIAFTVSGVAFSAFVFVLSLVSTWLNSR